MAEAGRLISRIALVFLLALPVCAQSAAAKFRVAGKVVNAVDGQPLAGAEVWLGAAGESATEQKLLTGDDGAFAFTVADAGKYVLRGQANGFRRQAFEQHGSYLSLIVVGSGLSTDNLVLRLRPDARILGVVEDDDHEPLPGATIYLFRTDANFGLKRTYFVQQTVSDDRGRYRMAHLEPGSYYLAVSANPWFGALLEEAENAGGTAASEKPEFDVAYPMTFYPGATDSASASRVALKEGEDFNADFTLSPVPGLRVRVNPGTADAGKSTQAALQQRALGTTIDGMWQRQVRVEDATEIRGVAPGQYLLNIVFAEPSNRKAERSMMLDLTDNAEIDLDSVEAPKPIRGVVRMQGGESAPEHGIVRLWNSRTGETLDSQIGEKGEINFNSELVNPSTYAVYAMSGGHSIVSSLKATGAQVMGQTVQIAGGKAVELEIEMSSSLAKIEGTARRGGKPVSGAMIVIVPEIAEINLPKFRRDQSDSDGTFTLRDVLPGRYRVLAIENGWDLEWADPSLLAKRLEHAQKIDIQGSKTYKTAVEVE